MTPKDLQKYFGTQAAIARAIGAAQSSVAEWFQNAKIPEGRQYQIEIATNSALKADKPALRETATLNPNTNRTI